VILYSNTILLKMMQEDYRPQ